MYEFGLSATAYLWAGSQSVQCLIVAVMKRPTGAMYQVVWWAEGKRSCEWVSECELSQYPMQDDAQH